MTKKEMYEHMVKKLTEDDEYLVKIRDKYNCQDWIERTYIIQVNRPDIDEIHDLRSLLIYESTTR